MNYKKQISTKNGRRMLLRFPGKGDADKLRRFINALVEEDTLISNNKKEPVSKLH